MDNDFRERLIDYFEPHELIYLLDVDISDLVDLLEDHIQDKKEFLDEFVSHGD